MKSLKDNLDNQKEFALKIQSMLGDLGFFNSLNSDNQNQDDLEQSNENY